MTTSSSFAEGFKVAHATLGGTTVLSPSAALTHETCAALRAAVETAAEGHAPRVVLDCGAVAYMDSAALELLVESHEKLNALRGELRLTHLNEVCSDILIASRLVHTLTVSGDIRQAIKDG